MGSYSTKKVSIQNFEMFQSIDCFLRLSEEAENYSRTLRQSEERFRLRLAEIQEEKALALEEKELHCLSLIAREQNNQQGLQVSK